MLPITSHSLEKLETLLRDLGYRVRYERGNFKTGACILQHDKVVVVNRFYTLEAKIHALVELVRTSNADASKLSEKQAHFLGNIRQTKLSI